MATQTYIPAGARIVVKSGKDHVWHTTREEIPVVNPKAAKCPRTGVDVQTIRHQKHDVWFPERIIRSRFVPDEGDVHPDAAQHLRACLLYYDIPTDAVEPGTDRPLANPSHILRRIAVRVNLSCWVIREADIPYALMHRLSEAGAVWNTVPFDPAAGQRVIETVITALRQEVEEAQARSQAAAEAADRQMADTTLSENKTHERYLRRAEGIQERFRELKDDLEQAALRFGINPTVLQLATAATAVQAIGTGMHERARLYLQTIRNLEATGHSDAIAIARAGRAEEVPACILADAADDFRAEGGGQALRTAFEPPPEPEPATVGAEGDGTFSLLDGIE